MTRGITFWKCRDCNGTGRKIFCATTEKCFKCDGTGNALIDGAARAHRRRLDEIDAPSGADITTAIDLLRGALRGTKAP